MKPDTIAYFSMEIAVEPRMPTYSGGLGVLAGDTIRGCADHGVPMIAVSLLHRQGYLRQRLDAAGRQHEKPDTWKVERFLQEMEPRVTVSIEGRDVLVRAWRYEAKGVAGDLVPVYFLDTALAENSEWDRALTDYLYGGDEHHRLCQEAVLGIGGARMLYALGYRDVRCYHLNESHAALLAVELMRRHASANGRKKLRAADLDDARRRCVFTTHTPVPAGHDQFPPDLVRSVLQDIDLSPFEKDFCSDGKINLTWIALAASHYVNAVAQSHRAVSQAMFPSHKIDSITNGVHIPTWASPPFLDLFDKYIPGWRERTGDSFSLRHALNIPAQEVWQAHSKAKNHLLERVNRETKVGMDPEVLTLGFARRMTAYKRHLLLFQDMERLKSIVAKSGKLQIIYAGKAHPRDDQGKELIHQIFQARNELKDHITIAFLSNYNWKLGALLTAGVDVWLNTPQPPLEACGTSGMKAAINGVPSLSILDGWWREGCIEGKTGWAIDPGPVNNDDRTAADADALYRKLEKVVMPLYYRRRDRFIDVMTNAIAINGSYFNVQRMVLEYVLKAYA